MMWLNESAKNNTQPIRSDIFRPSKILAKSFNEHDIEFSIEEETINEEILITDFVNKIDDEDWINCLKKDKEFGTMYTYIKDNILPPKSKNKKGEDPDKVARDILRRSHQYVISKEDKKLYYCANPKTHPNELKLCVPSEYRRLVIEECHDALWSGAHMGRDKTITKIKDKYTFPGIHDYVDLWISTCPTCQENKRRHPSGEAVPLGVIEASRPGDLLCIDIWDPCVRSTRGFEYILTVVDGFSKFAYAIPIRNKSAKAVAEALVEKVFPTGIPNRLHSDQGKEFINDVIKQLSELMGIDQSKTTAYHPQGNAYAERIHQFFRNATTAYIRRDQRNWDIILPLLAMVYNDTEHSALGRYSPSELFLGRKLGLPLQKPLVMEEMPKYYLANYAEKLKLALNIVQKEIMEKTMQKLESNLAKSLGKNKLEYKVGDDVALSVENIPSEFKSAKLFPRWKGPYRITKLSRDKKVIYLKDDFDNELNRPVSVLRIKPWKRREDFEDLLGPDRFLRVQQFENVQQSSEPIDDSSSDIDETIVTDRAGVDIAVESAQNVGNEIIITPTTKPSADKRKQRDPSDISSQNILPGRNRVLRSASRREVDETSKNLVVTNTVTNNTKKSKRRVEVDAIDLDVDESLFVLLARTVVPGKEWTPPEKFSIVYQ
jgi:transposase InsO family protein